jgi:hypothetical protein
MVTNVLLFCERHGGTPSLKGVAIQGSQPQQVKEPWRGISWSLRLSWVGWLAGWLYFETRGPNPGPGLDEIFDDISMYLLSTSQCRDVFRIAM